MPAHSRLEDPEFRERLEVALRCRRDGHLSLRSAAKVAGLSFQVLRRWETRLRAQSGDAPIKPPPATPTAEALRRARAARRKAADERRARREAEAATPRRECHLIECHHCRGQVLFDGHERFDVLAELPHGGWLALSHDHSR